MHHFGSKMLYCTQRIGYTFFISEQFKRIAHSQADQFAAFFSSWRISCLNCLNSELLYQDDLLYDDATALF